MSTRPPNVILCVSDQLRPFELGCYGHPVVRTPHLDQLAANGVRFETVCSNNPLCTPARGCLLTGHYSRTCQGIRGNVDEPTRERKYFPEPTIAEMFRAAGYDTALIGKWHLPPPPASVGFDQRVYPAVYHRYSERLYFDNSTTGQTVKQWTWDYEMEHTRQYLRGHRDRPFFLYFNIEPPHMPLLDAPERYTQMYSRDQVQLRPNTTVNGRLAYDEEWFKIYVWDYRYYREKLPYTETLPAGFDLRSLTALYYGLVTLVDDQVGRLVDELKKNDLLENTILLFTSDHGDELGSHGCFNKGRVSEESIRVPLIVHWPAGLQPRFVTAQVASLVDVMPTLLGLAGQRATGSTPGVDLTPVIRGESATTGSNCAFIEAIFAGLEHHPSDPQMEHAGVVAVRGRDHLYAAALRDASGYGYRPENDEVIDDRYLFFDLRSDPYELNNLAKTDAQPAVAADLRERLLTWHRHTPWLTCSP